MGDEEEAWLQAVRARLGMNGLHSARTGHQPRTRPQTARRVGLTRSALARQESRGSHYRSDFPEKNRSAPRSLFLAKAHLHEAAQQWQQDDDLHRYSPTSDLRPLTSDSPPA